MSVNRGSVAEALAGRYTLERELGSGGTSTVYLARDERDAWINWPARAAAVIAAELQVDSHQLHTVLERQVREHLAELAEIKLNLR